MMTKKKRVFNGLQAKRKGARAETEIVKVLCEDGFPAKKIPLSGAMEGWPGDLTCKIDGVDWLIQVKSGKLVGYGRIMSDMRKTRRIIALKSRSADVTYYAMDYPTFLNLCKGETPPLNVEEKTRSTGTIDAAVKAGEPILMLRPDRSAGGLPARASYCVIVNSTFYHWLSDHTLAQA